MPKPFEKMAEIILSIMAVRMISFSGLFFHISKIRLFIGKKVYGQI